MKFVFTAVLSLAASTALATAPGTSLSLRGREKESNRHLVQTSACGVVAQKTASSIKVDGLTSDWNLGADFLKDMYEAGRSDFLLASKLYGRYDCVHSKLCLLVLAQPNITFAPAASGESWLKDYSISNSIVAPIGSIVDVKSGSKVIGWEGCFVLPSSCRSSLEIHASFGAGSATPGRTSSTGKAKQGYTSIDLSCACGTTSDCLSDDGCIHGECVDKLCSYNKVDGCDCDTDDDCTTSSDSFVAFCRKEEADQSMWKCAETEIQLEAAQAGCGTNEECCVMNPDKNKICAVPTCNVDGTCGFTASGSMETCDSSYVPKLGSCDLGYFCEGTDCKQLFKSEGESCSTYEIPSGAEPGCFYGMCGASGECLPVVKEGSFCPGMGPGVLGVCDKGTICSAAGTCQAQYEPATTECRPAAGCCDKAEFCSGSAYNCVDDVKFGAEKTCRASCVGCIGDPAEVCDGVNDSCPDNTILKDAYCIKAGQFSPAGTVTVQAQPMAGSSDYEFCVQINTIPAWQLTGDYPIKAEFSFLSAPGSSPGLYTYKYSSAGIVGSGIIESPKGSGVYVLENGCLPVPRASICSADPPTLYFAVHLDVTGSTGGQTAWALGCDNGSNALQGVRFLNNKGTGFSGWGSYFAWTPCCPDDPDCEQCGGALTPLVGR